MKEGHTPTLETPPSERANPKIIRRYVVKEVIGIALTGTLLFWPGGDLGWWPAWALLFIVTAWCIATAWVILRSHPDLLAERLGPRKNAKSWDTGIMSLVGIFTLGKLIVAGLDHRYGWTVDINISAQVLALGMTGLGYALAVWAIASNAYFSQIARIQAERDHRVVTGGPYKYIRHPGYLGSICTELAVPILLASRWALMIGGLNVLLFILRTVLEDRMLQLELDGYSDYKRQVRYRLLPWIW